MAKVITIDAINESYTELRAALVEYHQAAVAEAETKATLDRAALAGLADCSIAGKNAEMREAAAREALPELFQQHETAARLAADAKNRLDLARVEVERVKMLMRIVEVNTAATREVIG